MRHTVSKMLVGIDGSDHSFRAAEYAIEIARNYKAELFAVTVTYIPDKYRVSQMEVIEENEAQAFR
jgi:nucleotide-binding universal stress UspA family protein